MRIEGGWIRLKLLLQSSQALPIVVGFAAVVAAPTVEASSESFAFLLAFAILLTSTAAFFMSMALFTVFVPRKVAYHDNLEAFVAATLHLRRRENGPSADDWTQTKIDAWDASNFDRGRPIHGIVRRLCWILLGVAAAGLSFTSALFFALVLIRLFN